MSGEGGIWNDSILLSDNEMESGDIASAVADKNSTTSISAGFSRLTCQLREFRSHVSLEMIRTPYVWLKSNEANSRGFVRPTKIGFGTGNFRWHSDKATIENKRTCLVR